MHPRNPYAEKRPDFKILAEKYPEFKPFVKVGNDGDGYAYVDWKDSDSLRTLTRVLLREDWNLDVDLPKDRLCPTIPNRLDYIFHLLDLRGYLPRDDRPLRVLDIGTGAVAIYPLLIHRLCPDSIITATEKDLESLEHAKTVLRANSISPESITLVAPTGEAILFPLLDGEGREMDISMCNPPFFASLAEMQEGREMKSEEAHTAHTGSDNEMVTDGGEVGFINQMIDESQIVGNRCSWYTSLAGRYSSLPKVVTKLQSLKITNYYILSIRPARTVRWIIVWSFTHIRLPDSLTRPDPSADVPSSYFKLLPLGNTVRHVVRPHRPVSEVKAAILEFLGHIGLYTDRSHSQRQGIDASSHANIDTNQHAAIDWDPAPATVQEESRPTPTKPFEVDLVAYSNSWSRAARRKLRIPSRAPNPISTPDDHESSSAILKATLRIMDGQVEMDWTYGMGRRDFDSLWKSILANSGLISRGQRGGDGGGVGDDTLLTTASKSDTPTSYGTETANQTEAGDGGGVSKRARSGQEESNTMDSKEHEEASIMASKKTRTEL